jgi:hypothetical protein
MASDLEQTALSAAGEAIWGMEAFDFEEFRDKLRSGCAQAAEDVCTYGGDCAVIISRYENEPEAADAAEHASEAQFSAEQWGEAREAWARAVAYCVLSAKAEEIAERVSELAEHLSEAAEGFGADLGELGEPRVSLSCIHGWAVHAREDSEGVHFWYPAELEGCRAVAMDVGPFWLSYTWTANTEAGAA